jgi:hypothetical protein
MFKNNLFKSVTSFLAISAIVLGTSIVHIDLAYAAALTTLSDTQSSVKVSALSDHTIQFVTPSGISAAQTLVVTFPVGWSIGANGTTSFAFATSTSATCSGFTDALINSSASGLTWGVATTTTTVTITSGTAVVPANRCIQIRMGSNATANGTTSITNPSSATSSVITIGGGTFADTGSITTNIITNDTVSMTGTVSQSLSFTISTSTIYFGTLSNSFPKYASSTNPSGDTSEPVNGAHNLQIGTNAPSGYTITVRGQTLTSQQNSANTIDAIGSTPAMSSFGTEQFGIRATVSGGTGFTVNSTYASTTAYGYNGTATSSSVLATGSGSTNTTTYSLRYLANISALTEAGTYAANLVYVATANF